MLHHGGLGEEDPQALLRRGDSLMKAPGFFSSLLGRGADPDAACACYVQAAQRYKVTKKWTNAADAYVRAAGAAQRAGDDPRSASLLVDAGSTLKRVDTEGARRHLDAAAAAYIRMGRWGSAGKVYRSIAEMLEAEPLPPGSGSGGGGGFGGVDAAAVAAASDRHTTTSLSPSQSLQQRNLQRQQQQHQQQEQQCWEVSDGSNNSSSNSGRNALWEGDNNNAMMGSMPALSLGRTSSRSRAQQQQLQQSQTMEHQMGKDQQMHVPLKSENALHYYKKAAEAYDLDDYGKSACSQCRIKYAELAAKDESLLQEAIRIYEEEGDKATKSELLQFSARDFFFRAILLLLSTGDIVSAKIAAERYNMRDPRLENSREGQLAAALLAAAEDGDADAFTAALHDYDRISKLDSWKIHFLLRAKRKLLLDGGSGTDGGEEAEEAFIGEDGHVDLS